MSITLEGHVLNISKAIDISVSAFGEYEFSGFGLGLPARQELRSTNREGGGWHIDLLTHFCAHVHGTHVESKAHLRKEAKSTQACLSGLPPLLLARVIDMEEIANLSHVQENVQAVIIRSGWLSRVLQGGAKDLTLMKPPFLLPSHVRIVKDNFPSMKLLGFDSISVDPAEDGGKLLAHQEIFASADVLIMELCYLRDNVCTHHGTFYALSLNAANIDSDAVPCRPILYPLT